MGDTAILAAPAPSMISLRPPAACDWARGVPELSHGPATWRMHAPCACGCDTPVYLCDGCKLSARFLSGRMQCVPCSRPPGSHECLNVSVSFVPIAEAAGG